MALKRALEAKLLDGGATGSDIRLLIAICKDVGDTACVDRARTIAGER